MRKFALGALAIITSVPAAWALAPRDAAYYCAAEFAGGLTFNKDTRRWQSTTFIPSRHFVLKLKYLRSRTRKDPLERDERVNDYTITITDAGGQFPTPCVPSDGDFDTPVSFGDWDAFRCTSGLDSFYISLKTNRFLRAYIVGYVDGRDDDRDTPSMAGGVCTKVD